jgi:hypothetical protein
MKRFYFLLVYLSLGSFHAGFPQNLNESTDSIFSFPFSLESKLLVFKGQMNGVETDFAFDTGASMGLANSLSEPSGKLKVKGKQIKMRDSNNEVKKVKTGVSDEIQIGGFTFSKVRSLVNDMTFLYCMDFYLLGSDVIRQLNWEIDFEKKIIHVSKSPFPVDSAWVKMPVKMVQNRPFTELSLGGSIYHEALIDFGYTSMMDFPASYPDIQNFLAEKDSLGLSNPNISTSMGALGKKTFTSRSIRMDSVKMGGSFFTDIQIDFEESSSPKIGVGFFSRLTHKTILNHDQNAYYLKLRGDHTISDQTHVTVMFEEGKLILAGKPVGLTPDDGKIEVGEEIRSINGFSAADFEDECSYFSWSINQKSDGVILVKMDGTSLTFPRIALK